MMKSLLFDLGENFIICVFATVKKIIDRELRIMNSLYYYE